MKQIHKYTNEQMNTFVNEKQNIWILKSFLHKNLIICFITDTTVHSSIQHTHTHTHYMVYIQGKTILTYITQMLNV